MPARGNGHCPHYWLCEPANGPTSKARCKLCQAKVVFSNDGYAAIEKVMQMAKRSARGGEMRKLKATGV